MSGNPLKDGVCPWGSASILLKHHRNHPLVKLVEVIPVSLTITPAFGLLFSEKFTSHREIWGHGVDADVKPEFGTRWLNDVQVSPMDGSNAARGRLSIFKGLTRHKHILFNMRSQSRLAGHKSEVISHTIVPTRVQPFVAQASMSCQRVKDVIAALTPWGCAAAWFPSPWGGYPKSLLEPPTKDSIKKGVGPPAGQGVQPVALPMVSLRPGRVIPWQVAKPSMAECLRELSTTKPQSIDSRRIAGVSKLATEVSEAEPRGRVHQVASKGAGVTITNVSETVEEDVRLRVDQSLSVECSVRCPGHGGKSCTSGNDSKRGEVWKTKTSSTDR